MELLPHTLHAYNTSEGYKKKGITIEKRESTKSTTVWKLTRPKARDHSINFLMKDDFN